MKALSIIFSTFLLGISCAGGKTTEWDCPERIDVNQSIQRLPEGWEDLVENSPASLERVGVFSGHPNEMASLVPDNEDDVAGQQSVWTFPPHPTQDIWVACFYRGTQVFLAKKAPPSTKECIVQYEMLSNGDRSRPKKILFK